MQKKKFKVNILMVFLALGFMINTKSSIAVSYGDSFVFEITDADHYLESKEITIGNDGYITGGYSYPIGTKVNASYVYENSGGIMYNLTFVNRTSVAFIDNHWLDILGVDFSYMTLYHTYQFVQDYHHGYLIDLYLYQIKPHVAPYNNYLLDPESLGVDICDHFSGIHQTYADIECLYNYSYTDDLVYFESWVGGWVKMDFGNEVDGLDYPSDITFGNSFRFCINATSGIVYGLGRQGWVKGKINDMKIKVSMRCQYELDGFDMPDYLFGSYQDFSSGRDYLAVKIAIPISGIVGITISSIIVIKRKKLSKVKVYQSASQQEKK